MTIERINELRRKRFATKRRQPLKCRDCDTTTTDHFLGRCRVCIEMAKSEKHYQPIDGVLASPRVRLLRAMSWFDWERPHEIFETLGVMEPMSVEANTLSQALSRLCRDGLAERRICPRLHADYRLTQAGHQEADRMRIGFPSLPRIRARRSA